MIFPLRLSESFDRFEIDTLEDQRQSNGHHDRRRQSLRDRSRRSVSRSYSQSHSYSHNYNFNRSFSRNHHHGSSRERSMMRHERSRSRSMHGQSRQHARKSSVKDRLGTPVKKPSKQHMSPQPSTSKQEPRHRDIDEPDVNANGGQTLDEVYDTAESQEPFDMSDLDSILNKCICKFPLTVGVLSVPFY